MIKFLSKQQKTIGGAAFLLGFFSISSQLLAIVKNKLLAVYFGADQILDIYFTAFKIPDLIFLLIGTMASGAVLIPLLEKRKVISEETVKTYLSKFFNSFSLVIILVSVIVFFAIPYIVSSYFSGFVGDEREMLILMTRIMLLSPILMGMGNIFIAVNQRNKIFLPMALTGIFYNLSIIFSIVVFYPIWGIYGLAFGVILGALLYLLIQAPSILKTKLFEYKFSFFDKLEFSELFKVSFPRSLALAISSFILFYFYSVISGLEVDGLITIFAFAFTIYSIPMNLINGSYSPSVFPYLAEYFSKNEIDNFNHTAKDVMSRILFLVIPISIFFFTFSNLIIGVLFASQKFTNIEVKSTAIILSIFSLLIVFNAVLIFISKIYYSMGRTAPTLYANFSGALLVLIIFNVLNSLNINWNFIGVVGEFNFLINAVVSFVLGYAIVSISFLAFLKHSVTKLHLLDLNLFFKKIFISVVSVLISLFSYNIFFDTSFLTMGDYIINLIFVIFVFFICFVILSEILKDTNYLSFKAKVLNKFKISN